jgi:predicted AAA+ superfamily ATPase
MADINHLLDLGNLARDDGMRFSRKRPMVSNLLVEPGRHAVGIVGPRGVGKTVVLKQLASAIPDSLYVSMDAIDETNFFDTAKKLHEQFSIKTLFLDEIHFYRDFPAMLKKIYDFLNIRIFFTSSVALSLFDASVDLSRRVRLISLYPFSFKEFVAFKTNEELPALTLDHIIEKNWSGAHLRTEYLFDEYLKSGLMPFALEEPSILPLLRNIIDKIVGSDIPATARLTTDELPLIHKCLTFIGQSSIDGINYSSLSRNVGITKYKAEAYVHLLEKAFVLNVIQPVGSSVTREPKILMCLPYRLLYAQESAAVGGLREDYFVEAMRSHNSSLRYLKSVRGAKTPDYIFEYNGKEYVIEIGGKGKGREQFKDFSGKKQIVLTHPGDTKGIRRPLFMIGFMENEQ